MAAAAAGCKDHAEEDAGTRPPLQAAAHLPPPPSFLWTSKAHWPRGEALTTRRPTLSPPRFLPVRCRRLPPVCRVNRSGGRGSGSSRRPSGRGSGAASRAGARAAWFRAAARACRSTSPSALPRVLLAAEADAGHAAQLAGRGAEGARWRTRGSDSEQWGLGENDERRGLNTEPDCYARVWRVCWILFLSQVCYF